MIGARRERRTDIEIVCSVDLIPQVYYRLSNGVASRQMAKKRETRQGLEDEEHFRKVWTKTKTKADDDV